MADLLKLEIRNDNLVLFQSESDYTMLCQKKQPDDEVKELTESVILVSSCAETGLKTVLVEPLEIKFSLKAD